MNNERIPKVTLCKKKENLILLFSIMSTIKPLATKATKKSLLLYEQNIICKDKIPKFEPMTFGILPLDRYKKLWDLGWSEALKKK